MPNGSSSLLDRAIGYLSPAWAMRRSATRVLARYYEAGDVSRRTQEWKRPAGDANAASSVSLERLRNAARHLVRNNGYAESGLGTIVDDVVGWGIVPTAKLPTWKDWTESTQIDAEGRHDLPGLEQMVMRTVVESGECLIRRRFRRLSEKLAIPMQIQILEPDFIDSSRQATLDNGRKIVKGIEVNRQGRRVAYYLFREHPGSSSLPARGSKFGESVRVPASEILHIFKGSRPGQVRGASWFAPILIRFKDFDEFADATLMKQKIAACLAVLTTDPDGTGTQLGATDPNDSTHDMLEPGMVLNMAPGREVEVVQPPAVREYADYVKTTLHEIASGLGVTPEDLTGDYSTLNFSAARMSRLRHWGRVQGWRWRMMIPQFLNPLWAWAMLALELSGRETAVNDDWTAPPLPMIEPQKEGLAILRNIRTGIMTHEEAIRERGFDPETFWNEYQEGLEELDRREILLDSDVRKMTQAGQAQFVTPTLGQPPEGPPEEDNAGSSSESSSSGNGNGDGEASASSSGGNGAPRPGDLMSIREAARACGIGPATIRAWVRKGAIPHFKIGPAGAIRVRAEDLIATQGPQVP